MDVQRARRADHRRRSRRKGYEEISRAKLIEPTRVQLPQRGGVCWSHPAFAEQARLCAQRRRAGLREPGSGRKLVVVVAKLLGITAECTDVRTTLQSQGRTFTCDSNDARERDVTIACWLKGDMRDRRRAHSN